MALTNSQLNYGRVSKSLHWLTALLVFAIIPLGMVAHQLGDQISGSETAITDRDIARAAFLFSLHKTLGVTIFALALLRILWTLVQRKPAPLGNVSQTQVFLADTVHWLLYGSLVMVPLTGWFHHAATTGFAPIWWPFGQSLPFIPKQASVAEILSGLHRVFECVLVLSILLHVAAALKHHLFDRDATLRRMVSDVDDIATPPAFERSTYPAMIALFVWGIALVIGNVTGAYGVRPAALTPQLLPVSSDWQVQDGALGISLTQLGHPVTGQFSDWVAEITFDETATIGEVGSVAVTINVASLRLGTVSDQAKGPDYLNVASHPTAQFSARLERNEQGYTATGPLTIRGVSRDITLPFDLELSENTARMHAQILLNRLDFEIAETVQDDATLGTNVTVTIALSATRRP